jgi:hypothetical protein
MKRFNPSSAHPVRATQAWQILVGAAMNRQTLTYADLGQKMYGRKAAGVLNKILDQIASYCNGNKLPGLTSIVVGGSRGTPGTGIPLPNKRDPHEERERVYKENWFDIVPPSVQDFADLG